MSSSKFLIAMTILFLVILIGGIFYFSFSANSSKFMQKKDLVKTVTPVSPTVTGNENPTTSTDLNSDSKNLDDKLNSLDGSLNSLDQSVNDQQTNLE